MLETSGLGRFFEATVSSEEVARGKPAPDVFLEAARRLGIEPTRCAAVEDSENGIHSAKAAGMRVLAIPNPQYPPHDEALEAADVVLPSIGELTPRSSTRASARWPGLDVLDRRADVADRGEARHRSLSGLEVAAAGKALARLSCMRSASSRLVSLAFSASSSSGASTSETSSIAACTSVLI